VRGLRLPLLAIVAGIVLVAGGGYLAFHDGGSGTPKVDVSAPGVSISDPVPRGCPDPRLTDGTQLFFKAYRSKGDVHARISCPGGVTLLSFEGRLPENANDFDVWLYNNRDDAKEVGNVIIANGLALGTVTIGDTSRYISIVLTDAKRRRPVPIGFQAQL
jgi:hypothetical protein